MNTRKELQLLQDELDKEELICPKCDEISDWYMINDWGMCEKCFSKYMKEQENENSTSL